MTWGHRRQIHPRRSEARHLAYGQTHLVATSAPRQGLRLTALAAALGVFMALVAFRGAVVQNAPQTAGVYSALGLGVNLTGLDLSNVVARVAQDGARRVLMVEGEIANPANSVRAVPPVRVALRGGDGQIVYSWAVKAPKTSLNGGEKVAFSARLAAPPAEAVETVVAFDSERPAPAKRLAGRVN